MIIQSGIPEKELRKREHNRIQTGSTEPDKAAIKETVESFLENGGKIKVYPGKCSSEHKNKPYIEFSKEEL